MRSAGGRLCRTQDASLRRVVGMPAARARAVLPGYICIRKGLRRARAWLEQRCRTIRGCQVVVVGELPAAFELKTSEATRPRRRSTWSTPLSGCRSRGRSSNEVLDGRRKALQRAVLLDPTPGGGISGVLESFGRNNPGAARATFSLWHRKGEAGRASDHLPARSTGCRWIRRQAGRRCG